MKTAARRSPSLATSVRGSAVRQFNIILRGGETVTVHADRWQRLYNLCVFTHKRRRFAYPEDLVTSITEVAA